MVYVYAYITLAVLATLFVLAACMLSARISREEEEREMRPSLAEEANSKQWEMTPTRRPIF